MDATIVAGVGTTLGEIHSVNQIGATVSSALGSNRSRSSLSNKTKELDMYNKPIDDSRNVEPTVSRPFVDIVSFGLRRGERTKNDHKCGNTLKT